MQEASRPSLTRTSFVKVSRYVSAFLNTAGGIILFGVDDDGSVTGCQLDEKQRDAVTKVMDQVLQKLDPQVEPGAVQHRLLPLHPRGGGGTSCASPTSTAEAAPDPPSGMLWVLHVCVRKGPQPVYYTDKYTLEAWIRRSESCFLMEASPALALTLTLAHLYLATPMGICLPHPHGLGGLPHPRQGRGIRHRRARCTTTGGWPHAHLAACGCSAHSFRGAFGDAAARTAS